jgi:predicted metal-binding membrane protein
MILFVGISALLFAASATVTIVWCGSMSASGGMPMPGGWTMSMAWMRMPNQTWPAAAATFLGMWTVMMVAMMLPSLVPVLWRYRQAAGRRPTVLAALGYFAAWTSFGLAIFPLGVAMASLAMRHLALSVYVPVLVAVVVLVAGALQFTPWKAHHLACCTSLSPPSRSPWRDGLRHALHCLYSSAGPTAILLVAGVMDLRVMAAITAAITLERLAPRGPRVARTLGAITLAAGLLLLAPSPSAKTFTQTAPDNAKRLECGAFPPLSYTHRRRRCNQRNPPYVTTGSLASGYENRVLHRKLTPSRHG